MITEQAIFEEVNELLISALRDELRKQGHFLTGTLEQSLRGEMSQLSNGFLLEGFALYYSGILNDGVLPSKIPFSGRTGNGGTSQYIQALIQYWQQRGLDEKEATRAAFATAYIHMKEGMSTSSSSRFSETGERQNFIGAVWEAISDKVDDIILGGYDQLIDEAFHQTKSETV